MIKIQINKLISLVVCFIVVGILIQPLQGVETINNKKLSVENGKQQIEFVLIFLFEYWNILISNRVEMKDKGKCNKIINILAPHKLVEVSSNTPKSKD